MSPFPCDSQAGGPTPFASLGPDGAPIEEPLGRAAAEAVAPVTADRGSVPGCVEPGTAGPSPLPRRSGPATSPGPGVRCGATPGPGSNRGGGR